MMEINSNQSSLVTILFMVFLTTSCSTVDVKTTEVVAVNQIIEDMPLAYIECYEQVRALMKTTIPIEIQQKLSQM